eukprot:TRINITY_DN16194_c0_g1_i1.p1 TRINITY_DN16194_c0_g1~~TRINITY_DN16194_c0_g1_i1.p1  ORF type:complete len:150 (-),score=6.25 TRINITY_DN16194_c0_g1_i1:35-484(-)
MLNFLDFWELHKHRRVCSEFHNFSNIVLRRKTSIFGQGRTLNDPQLLLKRCPNIRKAHFGRLNFSSLSYMKKLITSLPKLETSNVGGPINEDIFRVISESSVHLITLDIECYFRNLDLSWLRCKTLKNLHLGCLPLRISVPSWHATPAW